MLKTLRDMKIFLKSTTMNERDTKFSVKHAPKNLLNLDTSAEEESDSDEKVLQDRIDLAKKNREEPSHQDIIALNLIKGKKEKKMK